MITECFSVPRDPGCISSLFRILQEVSAHAVVPWNATGPELEKIGLMWVVIRYDLTLTRPLVPGEDLAVTTWASPVRHRMSQRNYLLADTGGLPLGRGAGVWALVDRTTRAMVDWEGRGIRFAAEETGLEPPRPAAPEKVPTDRTRVFLVTDNMLDSNGHMNNTRYFDIAQACMGHEEDGFSLSRIRAAFLNEALVGDELTVSFGRRENSWFFSGTKEGENCFQLSLEYV